MCVHLYIHRKGQTVCVCVCVCVHQSIERDSCLLVVLLKVVSLSALVSGVNSVNNLQICPLYSERDTSCWSHLQRDSGGVWAPKPIKEAQDETDDKVKREGGLKVKGTFGN